MSSRTRRVMVSLLGWVLLAVLAPVVAVGQAVTYPARPEGRQFVVDAAALVSAGDVEKIRAMAGRLLDEKNIPIVVVTIQSLANYGASGWTIDRYGMNLFDEWGIGEQEHNYGILLLVSKGDRKARIELGAGWTRERDAAAKRIMETFIVPHFKKGAPSTGILEGVRGLDKMARDMPIMAAATSAPASSTPQVERDSSATAPVTPAPRSAPSSSSPGVPSSSGGGRAPCGLLAASPLACLLIPIIAIVMIFGMIKRVLGLGGGFGGMMSPGGAGYQRRGWGSMGRGFGGGLGGGGWSRGGSSFGGGGGGSRSSFGGGSSGRGGATGSW